MYCENCGNEVGEQDVYCRRCGARITDAEEIITDEEQEKKKFPIYWVVIVLVIIMTIGICILLAFRLWTGNLVADMRLENTAKVTSSPEVSSKAQEQSGAGDSSTKKANTKKEKQNNTATVENRVEAIRTKYQIIMDGIAAGNYEKISQANVTAYYRNSQLRAVVVSKGVDGSKYSRSFYYDSKGLFFAYYEGKSAERLYFYQEKLIRWRHADQADNAEDAVNYDGKSENDAYEKWQNMVKEDSEIYKKMCLSSEQETDDEAIVVDQVSASSELHEKTVVHRAENICDGTLRKAWVEGVAGQGKGECVVFKFDREYEISGMVINAGYQKSKELYAKNSRPKKIQVYFSNGENETFSLKDQYGTQEITFSHPVSAKEVSVTILSVYPGSKYQDTVISELTWK